MRYRKAVQWNGESFPNYRRKQKAVLAPTFMRFGCFGVFRGVSDLFAGTEVLGLAQNR